MQANKFIYAFGLAITAFLSAYGGFVAISYPTSKNIGITLIFVIGLIFCGYKFFFGKEKKESIKSI